MGIHNDTKRLDRTIRKIKDTDKISEDEKEQLLEFKDEVIANGGTDSRARHYLNTFWRLCDWKDKAFEDMDKKDIKKLVQKINRAKKDNGEEYSENTRANFRIGLKKLFQFLEDYGWDSKEYPEKVKWISTTKNGNNGGNGHLPEEILSKEEVREMVKAAETPRNKAFIHSLYESGCRIGEFLPIKIKHLTFDNNGAVLNVDGKTGKRRIRLITSIGHLRTWLEHHPKSENPEAPLWVTMGRRSRGEQLKYNSARNMLKKVAAKTGLGKMVKKEKKSSNGKEYSYGVYEGKPVNPHMFRHSRATHLANKLTEAQMKELFGWTQDSGMASVYVHMSGRDVDNALLKMHGLKDEKDEEDGINCPRCGEHNSEADSYCSECGQPLNLEVVAQDEKEREKYDQMMSEVMEEMMNRPEVKETMKEIIKDK